MRYRARPPPPHTVCAGAAAFPAPGVDTMSAHGAKREPGRAEARTAVSAATGHDDRER